MVYLFVVPVRSVSLTLTQFITLSDADIVLDHLFDHLLEGSCRRPAEFLLGLGRIPQQCLDFGRAEVLRIHLDDLLTGRLVRADLIDT